jgi:hypothetical protein
MLNWARQKRPALQKKVSHHLTSCLYPINPCVFLLLVSDMKRHVSGLIGLFFCLRMGITIILYFTSLMIGQCPDYIIERFRGLECPVIFTPNNLMGCCNLTSAVL